MYDHMNLHDTIGEFDVSTVQLVDESYETMVFDNTRDCEYYREVLVKRYNSHKDAYDGHYRVIDLINSGDIYKAIA